MEVTARINREKRTLVVEIPLQKATPSKNSGKTLVIATTRGCKTTETRYSRRPIVVTANAFIYPTQRAQHATREEGGKAPDRETAEKQRGNRS